MSYRSGVRFLLIDRCEEIRLFISKNFFSESRFSRHHFGMDEFDCFLPCVVSERIQDAAGDAAEFFRRFFV